MTKCVVVSCPPFSHLSVTRDRLSSVFLTSVFSLFGVNYRQMLEPTIDLFEKQVQFTNEERRVPVYSDTEPPTNPHKVTHDTPLESLNLNLRERDLPEKERTKHVHLGCPYLGKFIPQLVEIFLRKYFQPGQPVPIILLVSSPINRNSPADRMPMICQFGEIPFRPLGEENLAGFSDITKAPFIKRRTKRHIAQGGSKTSYCLMKDGLDFRAMQKWNT